MGIIILPCLDFTSTNIYNTWYLIYYRKGVFYDVDL